jgi:hypothetical protein
MKPIEDLTEFSDQNYARELATFMGHVDNVSERRWQLILEGLSSKLEELEDENNVVQRGDLSIISEYRANIFISSSPIKG